MQASAQIDRLAGDLTVSRGHHSDLSDLFRATESSDRDSIGLNQIGAQHVGRDNVCGDSYSGQLRPLPVHLFDHLGLRCNLVRADYTTGIGSHRANENQPASLARHRRHDRGRNQKRRAQINIDRLVERREINIVEPLVSGDARPVRQEVDLAVLTDDRPDQQVDLFLVGDIRTDRYPAPSALRDRRRQLHAPRICSSRPRPRRPRQARSQSHTRAAAAVCYQCNLSVEIRVAIISRNDVIRSNGGCPSNFVHKARRLRLVRVVRAANSRR